MYKYGSVGSQNSIQPLQLTGSESGEDSETKTAFQHPSSSVQDGQDCIAVCCRSSLRCFQPRLQQTR